MFNKQFLLVWLWTQKNNIIGRQKLFEVSFGIFYWHFLWNFFHFSDVYWSKFEFLFSEQSKFHQTKKNVQLCENVEDKNKRIFNN